MRNLRKAGLLFGEAVRTPTLLSKLRSSFVCFYHTGKMCLKFDLSLKEILNLLTKKKKVV